MIATTACKSVSLKFARAFGAHTLGMILQRAGLIGVVLMAGLIAGLGVLFLA